MSVEKEITETQASIRFEYVKQGIIYLVAAALLIAFCLAS